MVNNNNIYISGSKSISNRLLILNQVLSLHLKIKNLSNSDDTLFLQKALKNNQKTKKINCGHAGTNMRFLTALFSITPGTFVLTGSSRLKQRPISDLVKALIKLGANITYLEKENYLPLKIKGTPINGGKVTINASTSSQFISALLLIAPTFKKGLELTLTKKIVSKPYIDTTVSMLQYFGTNVITKKNKYIVKPINKQIYLKKFKVESDWSSASYFYSLCAIKRESIFELHNFFKDSLQADAVLPQIYKCFGVKTTFKKSSIVISSTKKCNIKTFKYNFINSPDIAQTVAITCLALNLNTMLLGLNTLIHKETNRIEALKKEIQKFNVALHANSNSIKFNAKNFKKDSLKKITISTYNDHRMAMSFAPLKVIIPSLKILNAKVVSKSYPNFWNDFNKLLH